MQRLLCVSLLLCLYVSAHLRSGNLEFDSSVSTPFGSSSSNGELLVIDWKSSTKDIDPPPKGSALLGDFISAGKQLVKVLSAEEFYSYLSRNHLVSAFLTPNLKLDPQLLDFNEDCLSINVELISPISNLNGTLSQLYLLTGTSELTLLDHSENSLVFSFCSSFSDILNGIASHSNVTWIDPHVEYEPSNCHASALIEGNSNGPSPVSGSNCPNEERSSQPQYFPFAAKGITGNNEIVTVIDSGVDTNHCFFKDENNIIEKGNLRSSISRARGSKHRKVVFYDDELGDGADVINHGTHVTGTVAGKSIGNNLWNSAHGVAPDSKVIIIDTNRPPSNGLSIPRDLIGRWLEPAYSVGSRIISNSWGSRLATSPYTSDSALWDRFVYNNREALVVFAAGNSGGSGTRTIGAAATAKNVLTVGASITSRNGVSGTCAVSSSICRSFGIWNSPEERANENVVASFSSRGFTDYGGIKPDVVSTGLPLTSANPGTNCGVIMKAGTSMAAPTVAGAAALLREYLNNNDIKPTASLLRSLIIGSAVPLNDNSGKVNWGNNKWVDLDEAPSSVYGYGRVNLKPLFESVVVSNEDHEISNSNPIKSHCFKTNSNGKVIVTLAWTDPQAFAGCQDCIINPLELIILDSSGKEISNLNKPFRHSTSDRLIIPSAAGNYQILIKGNGLSSSQTYSLSVIGDVDLIDCDSCPDNCNNNGQCLNGICKCNSGNLLNCGESCPNSCSNQGKCINGFCSCEFPFFGHDCSLYHAIGDNAVTIRDLDYHELPLIKGISNYKPGIDVVWRVLNPSGLDLKLNIANINLAEGHYLSIYSESGSTRTLISTIKDGNDQIFTISTNIRVVFTANSQGFSKGFDLFLGNSPKPQPKPTYCKEKTIIEKEKDSFGVEGKADCTWQLPLLENNLVELNLTNVFLKSGDLIDVNWKWNNHKLRLARISSSTERRVFHSLYPLSVHFVSSNNDSTFSASFNNIHRDLCPKRISSQYCRNYLNDSEKENSICSGKVDLAGNSGKFKGVTGDDDCTWTLPLEINAVFELNLTNVVIPSNSNGIDVLWKWGNHALLFERIRTSTSLRILHSVFPLSISIPSNNKGISFDSSFRNFDRTKCPSRIPSHHCRNALSIASASFNQRRNQLVVVFSDSIISRKISIDCGLVFEGVKGQCFVEGNEVTANLESPLSNSSVALVQNDLWQAAVLDVNVVDDSISFSLFVVFGFGVLIVLVALAVYFCRKPSPKPVIVDPPHGDVSCHRFMCKSMNRCFCSV
ncbi:hypothetical protein P9112_014335 [Eukaryota sp. TZLM1-RC]